MNKLLRSIGAYLSYPLLGAAGAGRRFGRVPYIPVDVRDFITSTFEPPVPFLVGRPFGRPEEIIWDAEPPYPVVPHYIAEIPRGSADCSGYVFDASGRPVHGACQPRKQMLKYRWRVRRDGVAAPYMQVSPEPRHFEGRLGVVTATSQDFYYHWLFDILPRLHRTLSEGVDRVYMQRRAQFQHVTLDLLGIDPEIIINTEDEPWVSADTLVVCCHQIMTGHHHPRWVTDWLRERFLPLAADRRNALGKGRRVYVSRAVARNRRVVNEDEVLAVLEARGFERVLTEELPFLDQVATFAAAEAIIAPHGAGIANLVFCTPGAKVIEFFPSRTMNSYQRLCIDVGLDYAYVKTRLIPSHRRVGEDFPIALEDLIAVLDHMGL